MKIIDELANVHNGKCISREYIDSYTKLEWECRFRHRWLAPSNRIKNGHWCPYCAGNKKLTMKDMNKLSAIYGGKCISTDYKGAHIKLEWECILLHRWWAPPNRIKKGHWCPQCSKVKYITEEKCRFIIERVTGHRFPTTRTILGNRQEIDGFNEELKVGFEYQGEQHYKNHKRTTLYTEKRFKKTQRLDKRKKSRINYLKKQGIIKDIIFIKYTQSTSDKKLENYIIKRLNKIDPNLIKNTNIDYSGFYKYLSPLNDIKKTIEDKGGKLLSEDYYNNYTKIKIDCGKGHIFKITPNSLKLGHWCSSCSRVEKHTLEQMKSFAMHNNGLCESDIYINAKTKIKWRCLKCRYKWEVSYDIMTRLKFFCKQCKSKTILLLN